MGAVADAISHKLSTALAPSRLEVIDRSHLHAGHTGSRPGGETHFDVLAVSDAFAGLKAVARQRLVHRLLADELAGPIHALALTLKAPGEI
jgi:BolA family transcriptional regulator, general stress-responsive regulator